MAVEQPKKPVGGAFGIFVAENRPEFAKACAGQPGKCIVQKMAAAQWQALSAAKKEPYEKKYVAAKQKYDKDFAAFIEAGGVKSKGPAAQRSEKRKAKQLGEKPEKDPNRPKKPAGGLFGCFMADKRSEFAKACAGQPAVAVTKMASAQWKALPAAQKAPYEEVYQEKVKAYKEAMAAYVPPAGVEVESGDDEDAAEHAEDGEEVAASPPAKVLKRTGKPAATVSAGDEAVFSGLDPSTKAKLMTLTSNPKIMAKGLGASDLLATLKEHGGKVVAAKHSLLGA